MEPLTRYDSFNQMKRAEDEPAPSCSKSLTTSPDYGT